MVRNTPRTLLSALVSLFIMAFAFVSIAAVPVQAQETVQIRILSRWAGSDPTTMAFQQVIADFEALNPNIDIVDESIAEDSAYTSRIRSAMATGDLPHVFALNGAYEYAAIGMLLDLAPYLEADLEWSEGFVPGLVDTVGRFPELAGIYEFPMEINYEVFYYNPAVFEAAGIDAPPQTYEELLADVQLISDAGYVAIGAGARDAWRLTHIFNGLWMKSIGAERGFQLGTGETRFDDPDAVEVLARLQQLVEAGSFDENMGGIDYATEVNNFLTGQTGMIYNGTWFISELLNSDLADTVGVFLMPAIDGSEFGSNDILYANGWAVSNLIASDAEREAAIEFVKYLSGPEATVTISSITGRPPIRTDVASEVEPGRILSDILALQQDITLGGTDIFAYTLRSKMETIINDNIVAVALGTKTPEEAAAILAEEMLTE